MSNNRTISLKELAEADRLASQISLLYDQWNSARRGWLENIKEIRNYIFQTSTRDTTNAQLPWKNSTSTPKICQIADNLQANYMAALFPNEHWLTWRGNDEESEEKNKRLIIQEYMRNKTEYSDFRATVAELVRDWVHTGNAFATTEYVNDVIVDEDGNETIQYVGPRLVRISPYNIVFNPLAASWKHTPKIIRSVNSFGDIAKEIEENPEQGFKKEILSKMANIRKNMSGINESELDKNEGLNIDGFGNITDYFASGMVEVLEFYGDIWDEENETLLPNRVITIADRMFVIRNEPIKSWNKYNIRHVGWRLRPDNIYAQGPLDNLIGLQYRIDHLENLKADVFDLIAYPVVKVKGNVEDFDYAPGTRIICGEDGDVEWDRPPEQTVSADTQISILEQKMEDFAGAPKQAMGIRTPGEKTKFEVQTLENNTGRIFQNKTSYFEQMFLEPLINDMLISARKNMDGADTIRVFQDDIDVAVFEKVTKEDITANGRLKPIGARHFATQANMLQNLTTLSNSTVFNDQGVRRHFSGKKMAELIEDLLNVNKFGLVSENAQMFEDMAAQRTAQVASEQLQVEAGTPAGITADEEMTGA